jgi:Ca-activated chloride channel family protein
VFKLLSALRAVRTARALQMGAAGINRSSTMSATLRTVFVLALALTAWPHIASAAGTLKPTSAADSPLRIVDHHLQVLIENGYARSEVTQTFENTNGHDVEGIYSVPLPVAAALSELSISNGDRSLFGEVIERDKAQLIYESERDTGNQVGLAVKQGYQRFEFRIGNIAAGDRVTVTYAYYQKLELDRGIGRYLYPLEEGGTDTAADAFWSRNPVVDGTFTADIDLRSAWPIEDVRVPMFEQAADVQQTGPGEVSIVIDAKASLDHDLIVYYRLPDDLPGRVELVPYRAQAEGDGTFMLVLTPGVDLAPLSHGADYVFVLDVSASMETKLEKLKGAVIGALRQLGPEDRVRIVKFSNDAVELPRGTIDSLIAQVQALQIEGGTNLFAGLQLGLKGLDRERATSLLLVTDGVANEGVIDGPSFAQLLSETDVRVFGFLMGNSANWALMQLITDTSGGFYTPLSNADDLAGQLVLAREKMTHQAMHDFAVKTSGDNVFDLTHIPSKVHRGEQVVLFGRYHRPGPVALTVTARVTGQPKQYVAQFDLPARDETTPELERLWAYARVHELEYQGQMQLKAADEVAKLTAQLGVQYQLVTDETSMIVLDEATLARFGIDPNNRERSAREADARMLRTAGTPVSQSVPVDPEFAGATPSGGLTVSSGSSSSGGSSVFGGGAATPWDVLVLAALSLSLLARRRRSARCA